MLTHTQSMTFPEFFERQREADTFIILGVQGSGTNLLAKVMRNVFSVSVVQDRSLIISEAARVTNRPTGRDTLRAINRIVASLFPGPVSRRLASRAFHKQAPQYANIREWVNNVKVSSPADVTRFFLSYHAFANGRLWMGLKSDDVWAHIHQIRRVVAHPKYLYLHRDPRDNALSITNKDFGPCHPIAAAQYVKRQSDIYDRETSESGVPALTVKYEELLSTPRSFIDRFATFSGIQPTDQLDAVLNALNIRSSNHTKWRQLPARTLQTMEDIFGDSLAAHGYEPTVSVRSVPNARELWMADLTDMFARIPQKASNLWRYRVLGQ